MEAVLTNHTVQINQFDSLELTRVAQWLILFISLLLHCARLGKTQNVNLFLFLSVFLSFFYCLWIAFLIALSDSFLLLFKLMMRIFGSPLHALLNAMSIFGG